MLEEGARQGGPGEDCLLLSEGQWRDAACDAAHGFVCGFPRRGCAACGPTQRTGHPEHGKCMNAATGGNKPACNRHALSVSPLDTVKVPAGNVQSSMASCHFIIYSYLCCCMCVRIKHYLFPF